MMEMWPCDGKIKDPRKLRARQDRYNAIGKKKAMAYDVLWQRDSLSYAGCPTGDLSCVPDGLGPDETFSVFMKREIKSGTTWGWEYVGDYKQADPTGELKHWGDANSVSESDKMGIVRKMLKSTTWGKKRIHYYKLLLTQALRDDQSPASSDKSASIAARARHLGFHENMADKEIANVIVRLDEHYSARGVVFDHYDENVYDFVKAGETSKNAQGKKRRAGEPCAKASDWYTLYDTESKKK